MPDIIANLRYKTLKSPLQWSQVGFECAAEGIIEKGEGEMEMKKICRLGSV